MVIAAVLVIALLTTRHEELDAGVPVHLGA
jgi:hypothetical protein